MVKKISVIGAGAVGSHVAYHCLCRFDLKELVLLDIAGDLAKGIALDLEDTRNFIGFTAEVKGTSKHQDLKDSDIVVITAGLARKEGMTRYDLARVNAKITAELSSQIKRFAPGAVVVVITNPADFITSVVQKETGFDRSRVIGMGSSLDSARFANLIHKQIKADPASIHALVMGLHSKDMVPLASRSTVKNLPLELMLSREKFSLLKEKVQLRGKEIVDHLKKGSAFFAPSLTCAQLLEAIVRDRHELICVSTLLKGEYGLDGVCAGVPCVIGRKGILNIVQIELSEEERQDLAKAGQFFKQCMT